MHFDYYEVPDYEACTMEQYGFIGTEHDMKWEHPVSNWIVYWDDQCGAEGAFVLADSSGEPVHSSWTTGLLMEEAIEQELYF